MKSRRFAMVDVFSESPLLGNPLAVVLDAENLTTNEMMRITQWMNLSETTFLLPSTQPDADYRVRIFDLSRELPFAGHPTLGSCHAWLQSGGTPKDPQQIVQECDAGLIPIRRTHSRVAFAAPSLRRSGPVDATMLGPLVEALRISSDDIVEAVWADNGPGWIAVLLPSAQAVLDLKPVAAHPTRLDVGVVGPYPPGSEVAFEVRAFFSDHQHMLREDPVTGSFNAAVAQWLLGSGRAQAPYQAAQGQCVGRAGRIAIDAEGDRVWVGGNTRTVVQGHIDL